LICPCFAADNQTSNKPDTKDDRGDILLLGFWTCGTDCIVDVRVTNTDAKSYRHRDPVKVIAMQEKEKKGEVPRTLSQQQRHFTPFVCSTNGLLGREAETLAKRLVAKLSNKWQMTYAQVCRCVKAQLSIAIVHKTHMCLHGGGIPAHLMST
jgi:hypothetical protein